VKLCRYTLIPILLAAGVLAAGCGGTGGSGAASTTPGAESPAELLPAMQAAADAAQSVHVAGTVPEGSQTDTVNMSLAAPGDASGSITQGGNTVTVDVVGGNYYVEITPGLLQFAKVSPPDCGTVCGKYVQLPASEASPFTGDFTIKQLFTDAFGGMPSSARHITADIFLPTTYNGQPALKASFAGNTMVVARDGKPYVLEVSDNDGHSVVFSEWNSVPPITPPPASDVVSSADLAGL
jgi:hypothetical protein